MMNLCNRLKKQRRILIVLLSIIILLTGTGCGLALVEGLWNPTMKNWESQYLHLVQDIATSIVNTQVKIHEMWANRIGAAKIDTRLGQGIIMSSPKNGRTIFNTDLAKIKQNSQLDIVAAYPLTHGHSLVGPFNEEDRVVFDRVARGGTQFKLKNIDDEPLLISYFPIRFAGNVVGVMVLGSWLNKYIMSGFKEADLPRRLSFSVPKDKAIAMSLGADWKNLFLVLYSTPFRSAKMLTGHLFIVLSAIFASIVLLYFSILDMHFLVKIVPPILRSAEISQRIGARSQCVQTSTNARPEARSPGRNLRLVSNPADDE